MIPDINLKSYYLQFINAAKTDVVKYNEELSEVIKLKEINIKYIEDKKDILLNYFGVDIDSYSEWYDRTFNSSESLLNKLYILLREYPDDDNRIVLLQVIKYCRYLSAENRLNKLIELASKRKSIKYTVYRKYVGDYYNKVHEIVLQGMGYKYGYGIGTFVINHWKMDTRFNIKPVLDYNATNTRKKELLAQGKKLFDEKEAAWYIARNIPYDGIDYRVWKEVTEFYEFTFIHSDIFKRREMLEFDKVEYVNSKFRGLGYQKLADIYCPKEEDIYNMQVDIRYKLNMLLYKNPNKYLNFVRNASQCKYERGAHNS